MTENQLPINNKADRPWLFKKGQSGNPGGRAKNYRSLKAILEATLTHEDAAKELRYHILERHNLDALREFWDRTEGKPRQSVDISTEDDPRAAAMRQLAEEMRLARLADAAAALHYVELQPGQEQP